MRPHLGRVAGDKDRHIAEDADPHLARPVVQRDPLAIKEKLAELDEIDVLAVLLHPLDEGLGVASGEGPRPLVPRFAATTVAKGAKEGVVGEPVAVPLAEVGQLEHQLARLAFGEAAEREPQQFELERRHGVEIHPFGWKFRHIPHILIEKDAVLHQQVGADEELIAGKGGDRRVRRVPGPGRVQWKNLPPAGAAARQPLDVGCGGRAEVADAETRGQAGGMEDDTGRSSVLHRYPC